MVDWSIFPAFDHPFQIRDALTQNHFEHVNHRLSWAAKLTLVWNSSWSIDRLSFVSILRSNSCEILSISILSIKISMGKHLLIDNDISSTKTWIFHFVVCILFGGKRFDTYFYRYTFLSIQILMDIFSINIFIDTNLHGYFFSITIFEWWNFYR